jgi:hypothetical protein
MAVSDTSLASSASMTTRADAGKGDEGVVAMWLQAIDLAGRQEDAWRKRAEECCSLYRGGMENERTRKRRFNILYANVETLAPATYNSLPIPDIRRRFNEADPVSKQASTIIERCLSFSMEQEDFDGVLQRAVKDALLVGRAVTRVKYEATFEAAEITDDDAEEAEEPGDVETEGTCAETVSWVDFRHGPAKVWRDVPWIAFRHFLTRAEIKKLSPRNGERMDLDARVPGMDEKDDKDGQQPPDLFRRATVWEIWDREKREVVFIAPALKDAPLKTMDDPLGLSGFYPIPKPIYALESPDDLTPVEPYRLYKDLATELDVITRRISALTAAMKWRGAYSDPNLGDFLSKFKDLADGELAPLDNAGAMMNGGGLEKAFWFMPLEQVVQVVTQLYQAREQVKQSIYEVTGIADIVRGATKANETATAQQIKSQWGNLRIQHLQSEVGRFARDLLRLQAEIVAEKFAPETMFSMSGVDLPKAEELQAQVTQQLQGQALSPEQQKVMDETVTQEKVVALLQNDTLRRFRIDIETDSTIRADVQRQQENVAGFVQGFGSFIQAIGPAVQGGQMPMPVAAEMMKSFSRAFKLGRSVEDALEAMPTEQPPQADPAAAAQAAEQAKAQAAMQMKQMEMQAEQQTQAGEMQVRAAEAQATQQAEAAKLQADAQAAQLQAQVALQSKEMELQAQMQIEQARMAAEDQRAAAALAWERERFEVEVGLRQQEMQAQADLKRTEIAANAEAKRHATETGFQARTEATAAAVKSKGAK